MAHSTGAGIIRRDRYDAVLFDMDGVITDTAEAHAAAWKRLFDEYLGQRARQSGVQFRPFDPERDYRAYVDGKPRYDGVRSFLQSRAIELPWGREDDGPEAETICGLGNRKNGHFQDWLAENRVRTFPDALSFVRGLRAAGLRTAVFSSSRNTDAVLASAEVRDLFEAKVDGNEMAKLGLPGKPEPAIMQELARRLGVETARAIVVEDAVAGVQAGARGGFGLVIGVDRGGNGQQLLAEGAHVVVRDLGELQVENSDPGPRGRGP